MTSSNGFKEQFLKYTHTPCEQSFDEESVTTVRLLSDILKMGMNQLIRLNKSEIKMCLINKLVYL